MRNLLKRMLGIGTLACAFVLPLGGAQAAEVVSGDLVWGHEVRALRLTEARKAIGWLIGLASCAGNTPRSQAWMLLHILR